MNTTDKIIVMKRLIDFCAILGAFAFSVAIAVATIYPYKALAPISLHFYPL